MTAWIENVDGVGERRSYLIGIDAVSRQNGGGPEPAEVRMRFAARCVSESSARQVGEAVESLYLCGPSGGGGAAHHVREVVAIALTSIEANRVEPTYRMIEVGI